MIRIWGCDEFHSFILHSFLLSRSEILFQLILDFHSMYLLDVINIVNTGPQNQDPMNKLWFFPYGFLNSMN